MDAVNIYEHKDTCPESMSVYKKAEQSAQTIRAEKLHETQFNIMFPNHIKLLMTAINFERERGNRDVDMYCMSFREIV